MTSVKVAVRVRPFNGREKAANSVSIIRMEGADTFIRNPVSEKVTEKKSNDEQPMQCMTEMFIKPEELVSIFNPHLDRSFPKPPLPSDVLIALAVRNLDPNHETGATFIDIAAFIAFQFPYYNRNFEECKEIIRTSKENRTITS